jgi:hypothetical protein
MRREGRPVESAPSTRLIPVRGLALISVFVSLVDAMSAFRIC